MAKRKHKARKVSVRRRRRVVGKRRPAMGYVVGSRRVRRRKLNPRRVHRHHVARRRHHRRHNPRFSIGGITNQLAPAAFGAAGGLALDVALGYIPLPSVLQSGYGRHAARIVGALGIGWLATKFMRGRGAEVGKGALTIAVYGLLKDVAAKTLGDKVKGLAGDYETVDVSGYLDPGQQVGAYLPRSAAAAPAGGAPMVGAYMEGSSTGMEDY